MTLKNRSKLTAVVKTEPRERSVSETPFATTVSDVVGEDADVTEMYMYLDDCQD